MPRTLNGFLKAYYPAKWNAIQRWWLSWIALWAKIGSVEHETKRS